MMKIVCFTLFILKTMDAIYLPCATDRSVFCEHTCCYDKLKCDDVGGRATYLGADSTIGIRIENGDYHLYFSYRFMSNRFTNVSKYLKPRNYRYYGWNQGHTRKPFEERDTDCVASVNNTSPVTAMVHYKERYIFVCKEKILVYQFYNASDEANILFKDLQQKIDRKSSNCPEIYEPFCIRSGEDTLIEAVAVPAMNGSQILVAYFGEREVSENIKYNREYKIRAYLEGQLVFSDKMIGFLSAIDIIGKQDNKVRGLISKNDGMTCPFEYEIGHHNDYNFERLMDNTLCKSLQTFLACPQAWCSDAFLDASFTVGDPKHNEMVYLLLYIHLWLIPAQTRLPIDMPQVGERLILTTNDACGYVGDKYQNTVPCCMMDTLASFGMQMNNTEYVLSFKIKWGWRIVINRTKAAEQYTSELNVKGLIGDDKYYKANDLDAAFKVNGPVNKNTSWTLQKSGTLQDLGLLYDGQVEDGLEAVISMNGINYFFNQRFRYYEIPDGQKKVNGQPKFVQVHFFRSLSQCYYNDYEAYEALLNRLGEKLPEKKIYSRRRIAIPEKKTKKPPLKSSVRTLLIFIVLVGVLITVTGINLMHAHMKRTDAKTEDKSSGHLHGHHHKSKIDKKGKDVTKVQSDVTVESVVTVKSYVTVKTEAKAVGGETPKDMKVNIAKEIEFEKRKSKM